MKVDQSMITGESEPVESVVNAADPNALEARNIIFNGSLGKDRSLGKNIPLHPNSYNDTNTPFLSNLLYQWLTVDVWLLLSALVTLHLSEPWWNSRKFVQQMCDLPHTSFLLCSLLLPPPLIPRLTCLIHYSGDVGKTTSTLKADIQYFVQFLTIFALIQAALVFIVGVTRGISPVNGAQHSPPSASSDTFKCS